MHNALQVISEWREKYHVDPKNHDIVFQNHKLLTNIRFTNQSFNNVRTHLRGFSEIPETVISPSECWSKWEDPHDQKVVLRSYLRFSKDGVHVVLTRDGLITDAMVVTKSSSGRYRKGVILKS